MKNLMKASALLILGCGYIQASAWGFGPQTSVKETNMDAVFQPGFSLEKDQVTFAYSLAPISQWSEDKLSALSLFPEYRSVETLDLATGAQGLEIYESQAAFIVDRPASEISLKSLNAAEFIQSFDPDLKHTSISSSDANLIYQQTIDERVNIQLRSLENRLQRGSITQDQYQAYSQALASQAEVNGAQQWCQAASECILSEAPFPYDWQLIIDAGKGLQQIDPDFPNQIAFYSEVVKGTPAELSARPEVGVLVNRVAYPAQEVLIESSFVFNRFIQSGKTVISLHKLSENQTLVVLNTALFIEQDALTKYDMFNFTIRGVLLGNSLMNRDQGLAQGLPTYNTELAIGLKNRLEKL